MSNYLCNCPQSQKIMHSASLNYKRKIQHGRLLCVSEHSTPCIKPSGPPFILRLRGGACKLTAGCWPSLWRREEAAHQDVTIQAGAD